MVAILFVIFIASGIGFIVIEHKVKDPIIAPFIFKIPVSSLFYINTLKFIMTAALNWIVP